MLNTRTKTSLLRKACIASAFAAVTFTAFFLFPEGCVDKSGAIRALNQAGYTNVRITGWRPMAASSGDFYSTEFSATNPSGQTVTGVVTSGAFKGNTIRTD